MWWLHSISYWFGFSFKTASFFLMWCRNDAFENPVLQQHFRNLEALALDMNEPEEIEDLISKNIKHIKSTFFISSTYFCILVFTSFLFSSFVFFPTLEPKVDQIDQRLGPLVEEFKDLVYPAGYNPETKPAPKRKTGQTHLCSFLFIVYQAPVRP